MKLTKTQWIDIIKRAGKTFAQAFLGALGTINILGIFEGESAKRVALYTLISAIAAGCSAVWNFILDMISNNIKEVEDDKG